MSSTAVLVSQVQMLQALILDWPGIWASLSALSLFNLLLCQVFKVGPLGKSAGSKSGSSQIASPDCNRYRILDQPLPLNSRKLCTVLQCKSPSSLMLPVGPLIARV